MTDTGWYVYGVVDGDRSVDAPFVLVRSESLAAVVAPVDLAEFDDLDTRLNDRAWLEQQALAHEGALRRVAADGAVVPLRFGAIYHQLEDVEQMLGERREELAADLDRVRGHVELGVKGFVDRAKLAGPRLPRTAPGGAGRRRRGARDRRRRRAQRPREAARALRCGCRVPAALARALRPQRRHVPERGLPRRARRRVADRRGGSARKRVRAASRELRGDGPVAAVQLRRARGA
jgi:hypothetical protein